MIGIELRSNRAFASLRGKTASFGFDPAAPERLVAELRSHFGSVSGVALSIGLAHLWVKQITLPPASPDIRRRIIGIEPDRYFPVIDTRLAIATTENFALAMDAALLEQWVASFEQWAPVRAVEPVPMTLARVHANASLQIEDGVMTTADGALTSVRRSPASFDAPGDYDAAQAVVGAKNMLLSEPLASRMSLRRLSTGLTRAAIGVVLMVLIAVVHDKARAGKLKEIEAKVARVAPRAEPILLMQSQIAAAQHQSATQSDVLGMLQLLAQRMPPGAVILNLRVNHGNWQIDGTAPNAAALVPLLDREPRLRDVHMLSASLRFTEAERQYETFSIAFRDESAD